MIYRAYLYVCDMKWSFVKMVLSFNSNLIFVVFSCCNTWLIWVDTFLYVWQSWSQDVLSRRLRMLGGKHCQSTYWLRMARVAIVAMIMICCQLVGGWLLRGNFIALNEIFMGPTLWYGTYSSWKQSYSAGLGLDKSMWLGKTRLRTRQGSTNIKKLKI